MTERKRPSAAVVRQTETNGSMHHPDFQSGRGNDMSPHLPITRPAAAVFSARGRSDDTTRPAWATCFALLCRLRLSWPAGPWRGRRPGKAHHVACYLSILHLLAPAGACRFGAPGQSRRASFSPVTAKATPRACSVWWEWSWDWEESDGRRSFTGDRP